MHSRLTVLLLILVLSAVIPRAARASAPAHARFAVVIGNNRSLEHRRPDLHYADDDAARYFAILSTLAPGATYLLTDFDDDTRRLLPSLVGTAQAPTRANVLEVGRTLASRIAAAAAAGVETDLFFVFAGHGDVDQGTGFVELADTRFTSADLESWLRAIPATRAHVILDSCNSFFMLSERRPGGHYYATPEDAVRTLATHLPNVGVLLSTSAEGASFEWSEIESGVFSHVVRSGLLGAADADGDGVVTYLELAAFVATATADVANENMRPHIFARGPGGRDDEPIVPVLGRSGARTFRLSDPSPMRLRVADGNAVPLVDAHQQGGVALTLALPDEWADGATVERSGGELYALPPRDADLTLASLSPAPPTGAPRGPAEVFRRLFTRPFGPRAVAAYAQARATEPPPVYGVSREDAERMDLLLGQIESAEHGRRLVAAAVGLSMATYMTALGATSFAFAHSDPTTPPRNAELWGAVSLGLGGLSLAAGLYELARPSAGERLAAEYREALRRNDYAHAFALADERIRALAATENRDRWVLGIDGGFVLAASASIIVAEELSHSSIKERIGVRAIGGFTAVMGLTAMASALFVESPVQHLTTLWSRDPGHQRIQPTISPTVGGATIGVTGKF